MTDYLNAGYKKLPSILDRYNIGSQGLGASLASPIKMEADFSSRNLFPTSDSYAFDSLKTPTAKRTTPAPAAKSGLFDNIDAENLQAYAGLASTLLQAASLPSQLKLAKVQRQGLEQNLAQAKADSAINAAARSNLNRTL